MHTQHVSMAISAISYLFDRPIKPSHPWSAGLIADGARLPPFEQAVCSNLSMDWRVDAIAEARLIADFSALGFGAATPFDTLPRFFGATYCKPSGQVKFLSEAICVPQRRSLLHVGSLGGMLNRAIKNADARSRLQEHFALIYGDSRFIPARGDPILEDVAGVMQDGDEEDFRQTIELLHELLESSGSHPPFWWATFWTEIEGFEYDAESLVDALGLGEHLDDTVLLTYRYKAADVGLIYRPTTVEANNYAFHFPSPQTIKEGLSMPLNGKLNPCSEVIHHPPAASFAATAVIPKLLTLKAGKQLSNQYDHLATRRSGHRAALRRDYAGGSSAVENWLNRHDNRF